MNHTLPSDEEIAKLLIGCWNGIEKTHDIPMQYLTWYNTDGTLVSKGSMVANGQKVDFSTEGNWKVSGGKLINHVTNSTVKSLIGQDLTNAIAGIDMTTSVFVSSENALVVNGREDSTNPDLNFYDRMVVRTYQVMVEFKQTNRDQYANWLADDFTIIDMPDSLHAKRETAGLDNVLQAIIASNNKYTYNFSVHRVTEQSSVLTFEMTNALTIDATGTPFNKGTRVEVPACSIFELSDGKIAKQTNYVALGPDAATANP